MFRLNKLLLSLLLIIVWGQNNFLKASSTPPDFLDNFDLSGSPVLANDLIIGPRPIFTQGTLDGQGYTIFLDGDLTIPANSYILFSGDTVIDGQGHDIFFEDEAYFKIDGASGTVLTLRNCKIHGISNYESGNRSIMFGTSSLQKLALNDVTINLAGDFNFVGGGLDLKNEVKFKGFEKFFFYQSSNDITINDDSELFLDIKVIFYYEPADKKPNHLVMNSSSSVLFMNGCIFAQDSECGLSLIKGHLIVDHRVQLYNNGSEKKSWATYFGNNIEASNLSIDIMPSASIEIVSGGLLYDNVDSF